MKFSVHVYTGYIRNRKVVVLLSQEEKKGSVYVTTATVRKWGNSLAVRIPQDVSELGVRPTKGHIDSVSFLIQEI